MLILNKSRLVIKVVVVSQILISFGLCQDYVLSRLDDIYRNVLTYK